ncbi:MAG: anthranilate synthase component I family protein, partial [Saprospiraceae bacterium]|nr:anthranilate synthase component I family protein [Saprospiraceae bacterium]
VLNGLFGFSGFEAVQYFDRFSVDLSRGQSDLPDLHYSLFRYVIGIDHFKEELYLLENLLEGETSSLDRLESLLQNQTVATYPFELRGAERSNLTDEEFMELVRIGKQHCLRGDVFQIVFSRQFRQEYLGDDFNVYRILRSVNPSPYLFYFDFGSYRIFGSSPEAQLVIRQGVASVNPIAGTYRRTGDDEADRQEAEALAADPKERAEHIMLVDLARNDLGRHATGVQVRELMEIQYFSHVIHLVSKVEGRLAADNNPIRVFGDTFPAGTLSGAPKYRAIELIHQYENQARTFYGGAIGYIGFHGEMNQAIVIRSFLSRNNVLLYQAGAGIVAASVEERELQEVNNKLGALKKALLEAERIKA